MMNLTYNLASGTWLTPTGTAGTDWTPELNFGEAPEMTITVQGLPQGIALATAWQVAVAKDWQSSTSPMCRTTDDITCTVSDSEAVFSFTVDTATERFLRVVDGKGEGVGCSMQIVGISDGTPCCFVTMPWLCRPALDPHGSAGPLPPIPTTNMTEAEVEAIAEQAAEDIAEQAAQEAVEEALDDYYDKTATDNLLNGKANLVDGKVPASELPEMDYIPTAEKGAANGVAELDGNGKVPSGQLPLVKTGDEGSAAGAVKLNSVYGGVSWNSSSKDYLKVTEATNAQIDSKSSASMCFVTPRNLEYAVRSVLPNITEIPAATSAYTLMAQDATTNNHSWHYVHEPAAAPTYTLPAVTDATVVHSIDLKVKFSSGVLTYSFLDSQGGTVTPIAQPEIAAGTVVDFLCEYDSLSSQWAVMPLVLAEGGAA